jgi:5-methylthioadenosine/S-adenosylhomocysteine deaminase
MKSKLGTLSLVVVFAVVLLPVAGKGQAGTSAAQRADLLVTGGTVLTMDRAGTVIPNGAVAIAGGRIVAVGPRAEIQRRYRGARTIDATGRAIMPGLVNTHTHAAMSLLRGLADDLALQEWLEKYIFPAEARNVTADFVRTGTRLAALEMIRGGTTTFTDMYYFEDVVGEVTRESGLRGVLGETILDFPAPDNKTVPEALAYTEKFLQRWRGDPLVVAAVAPHSPYTCSADTLKKCVALAARYKAPILIHLAETEAETGQVRQKQNDPSLRSPAAFLDQIGLLGPHTVAAHAVWVDDADIALLRKSGTGVAHNPSSNMKLASGAAPVVKMLAAGVAVGLGTDGAASNNDLDMFEEADLASKLAKLHSGDPRALPATQALAMATIIGARAIGLEGEIGSLEPGKRADLITVRLRTPHSVPLYVLQSQLVYATKACGVEDVVVEGKLLMRSRRVLTLDENKILDEATRIGAQIRQSLRKQ